MRAKEFIKENWGPEKYPGILPIGDYLGPDEHEFAPPGRYKDSGDLHEEVWDLMDAGIEPQVVSINPKILLATQDWLSNAGGDEPLFPEFEDRPVIYDKQGKYYILDGHHRTTAALKAGRPISVYLFSDEMKPQAGSDDDINENFADGKVKGTELENSIPTGLYFDIDDVSVGQMYRGLGIGAMLYKLVLTCINRLNPKVQGLLSPRQNRLSTASNVTKIYSQLGGKVGIKGAKDTYDVLPVKNYVTLEVEPQPGAQIAAISGKNISFLVDEAGPYRVVLTVFDHNTMRTIGSISATAVFWNSETETLDNENIAENFADGKVRGKSRPGRVKRAGASCNGSVSSLRAKAKKYGGERGKMYHWCANMKGGRKK